MDGMKRAVEGLKKVNYALIDGNRLPENMKIKSDFIIKGDAKFQAISAASVLAKVAHDIKIVEQGKLGDLVELNR